MYLASGRAFTIAISCLVILFLFSNSRIGQTQDKSGQQTPSPVPSPSPDHIIKPVPVAPVIQPTATTEGAPAGQQKSANDVGFGQGPVITNTDLITVTVTVTDTYGRYVS